MSMTTVANPRTLGPPRQPQPHHPPNNNTTHTNGDQPLPLDKRSSIWATLRSPRAGKLTGTTKRAIEARAKLAAYAQRYARARLRAAGIPRPPDREAQLATYHHQQRAPEPESRLCACPCGQPIPTENRRGRPRKYIDETHRKRAQRRQR